MGTRAFERPVFYWSAIAGALLVVVAGILLVRYLSEPDTLSEKLGTLILDATPGRSCLNGEVSREPVRASERRDLYPDLLPRARSTQLLACDYGGAVSVVVSFDSRAALARAFRDSSSARSSGWCIVGTGAFDGESLDHRSDLQRFCHRLHGYVRPARMGTA